ncbi:MAG: AraC family transcriptional regulator [Paenibacillus sp.]|nr:AraC family transcriptional regulator [Paenibacillus sp.]
MLAQTDFLFHAMRPADTYVPMHRHRCYELVYYIAGSGSTRLSDTEYRYEPNTYTIIPPGMPHDERRLDQTDVIWIGFNLPGGDWPKLAQGLFRDTAASILSALLSMKTELQEKQNYYAQKLNLRVSDIVFDHLRTVSPGGSSGTNDNLLYTRTFIDENFNQKIAIEDLADIAGYSYHHYRHLFKKKFGVSPIRYLMDKRMEKARSMLRCTDLSITTIAMQCGFSNDAQFCTLFKREIGETPRSYRMNGYSNSLGG